ncbi:HNH endonuclease [Streptomyces gardneri]|uniref:HNH endonuclease n=1 Tax=Nocardia TaxID=1817 RepID=UPI00135BFC79|nr:MULTISPECIES: HNH endonuclease [Nocardia]MBF6167270.1 HNH endonuclease [Streptomyces gardneri]
MSAILLTWNPKMWNHWHPDYDSYARGVRDNGPRRSDWSVGNHRNGITPGTEAWLLQQGGPDARCRGILGHAIVRSIPLPDTHHSDSSRTTQYIDIDFDWLLPEADLIDIPTLEGTATATKWRQIYSSGTRVDPADLPALRTLWIEHAQPTAYDLGDEEVPGTYPEGATRTVQVNKYERSRAARDACIAHHGTVCMACGFDYGQVYGPIGADYIQVHHTVLVSQMGENYEVDPITDLVPLCANCHVMAHRRKPSPYTVRELEARVRRRLTK